MRAEDDIAQTFTEFCRTNGITIQGALHSAILVANSLHEANDRRPAEEWTEDLREKIPRGSMVSLARAYDAEARSRRTFRHPNG